MNPLQDAIKRLHGCESEPLEEVPVHEVFEGQTVWKGIVHIFRLIDHPEAERCYAWQHEADSGKTRYVAVLQKPPVDSAATAVRVAIAAEHKSGEDVR